MSEIQLQAAIFQHYWNNRPETRYLIFAVPNGGKRSKQAAAQLKASGTLAGILDLIILKSGKAYGLELKKPGEYNPPSKGLSDTQKLCIKAWEGEKIPCFVTDDFDEACRIIDSIFNGSINFIYTKAVLL